MLEVQDLKKRYGSVQAVDGISFTVPRGQTIGLLGPNGAGKTTTISMISGLVRPDSGEVRVEGSVIRSATDPVKRRIGLVPQDLALYDELPAMANLKLFAALYNISGTAAAKAIEKALELVGLRDRAHDKVQTYSGGMKRRLNLAAALLHDPQILLLDEPTVGVDPQSRNAIFDNLEQLKAQGKTLIYTTHYMEEAERLCDGIVIVDRGHVIANDTLSGLFNRLPATNRLLVDLAETPRNASFNGLSQVAGVQSTELTGQRLSVWLRDLVADTPAVLNWLANNSCPYRRVASESPSLETLFLTLTGRSLRDE